MNPRVTTIVPTYRRPRMLARAVRSALNQTYANLQVDIYDNASNDETAEVALALAGEDPRVRYHRRPANIGLVENFADAQRAVTSEYFSFLADDDVLLPEFYQRAVAALERQRQAMFVASPVAFVDPRGRILMLSGTRWPAGLYQPPDMLTALIRRGHFVWTGTMFRRQATEQVGNLDPRASVCSDLDFQLRLAGRFPFVTTDEMGAIFSWHGDSATSLPRLAQFWPAWEWIASRLAADTGIDEAARAEAAALLRASLPGKVLLVGLLAGALGREQEAVEAASVLSNVFRRPGRARLVHAVNAVCGTMPALRPLLVRIAAAIRWRTPVPRATVAEFNRRYRELLALPDLPTSERRKDSAA